MLTAEGADAIANFLRSFLAGGSIRVTGPDEQEASATIEGIDLNDDTVTVTATFTELNANFDWTARELLNAEGLVVDRDEQDFGRKVLGAVWTVEVPITTAGA